MHGSTYHGDGAQAIRNLAVVMREVLDPTGERSEIPRADVLKAANTP